MKKIFIKIISFIIAIIFLISVTSAADVKIPFTPLEKNITFTDNDAAQLAEALFEADFFNDMLSDEEFIKTSPKSWHKIDDKIFLQYVEYDIIKEKDYDVRRVELKHNYYIDIVFISEINKGVSSAYIRNKDGYVIAEITLTASFTSDGKKVKSASQKITGKSYVSQITFSDKTTKGGGEKSTITITDAGITLKIKDSGKKEFGEYKYSAQVKCDIYGSTIPYFSYQKKPYLKTEDKEYGAEKFDINGDIYYSVISWKSISGETTAKFIDINDDDEIPKFTDKDAEKLAEALSSVDYSKYKLVSRGKNYEIKRIQLKHGYYIDFVFRNQNDTVTSSLNYNKTVNSETADHYWIDIYIRDPNGNKLAEVQFIAHIIPVFLYDPTVNSGQFEFNGKSAAYEKSTATINYHTVWTESNLRQITFSSPKSIGTDNATDDSSIAEGRIVLKIDDGKKTKSFAFNMQIECYFNGIATAWLK